MFYDNRTTNPTKVFKVLSCVLYSIIENYVYIEYLCWQSKKLSVICCDKKITSTSYNGLIGIGIT